MTNTISATSENYHVKVDSNNKAYIEKYNHSGLFACFYDRMKKALNSQLTRFQALPTQLPIDVNHLEIIINENENRIVIRDKKTGISNRAIGFLR